MEKNYLVETLYNPIMKQIDFFQSQKEILEKLFPPEWFLKTKKKNHPAYIRWSLCKKITDQEGIVQHPEQKGKLHEIGRITLDSYILVALTEGNVQQLKLGSLDFYGDEAVQKKILSRINDPEQFEDLMVELYIGAWHKTKENHSIEPMEKKGCPDLKIEIPGIDIPIFIECKHLWTSSKNRLQEVIKKANKQIKKAIKEVKTPSYGVVVLDVSIPIAAGQVANDNLSDRLQELIDVVQSTLSGEKNRSVGVAIVIWDDYMIMGDPPNSTLIAFRRRYKRIFHKNANLAVAEELPLFEGYTTTYWLHWAPRKLPIKEYVFSDIFNEECQKEFNFNQTDVIDAIQNCDKTESLIFDGQKELMIFLRRISPNKDYMLICAERKTQSLLIYWAFIIFSDLCQEVDLLSPIQLLARFTDSYGLPITIGDITSKFIFAHRIETMSPDPARLISISNPDNHSFMNCLMLKVSQKDKTSFIADCALLFCIDTTRYMDWIKKP